MTKTEPHPDLRDAITFGLQSNVEKVSQEWESLSTDSRHQIWRVRAEPEAIIVKAYLPDVDRYYAHRWRREERALDLLNRHAPGLAPQPLTAVHASNRWAALAMQHVGETTLANTLSQPNVRSHHEQLDAALATLGQMRETTAHLRSMFRALVYESDLDRITRSTLERRYAAAFVRMNNPTAQLDPTSRPRQIAPNAPWDLLSPLIKPLIRNPRDVIHNGFSPLNLMWNQNRLSIIDWETLAIAAAEIDLADLLTFPAWGEPHAMVERSHELIDDLGLRPEAFWAAATERSLTYAATSNVRINRLKKQDPKLSSIYEQRLPAYFEWFQLASTELVPNMTDRVRLWDAFTTRSTSFHPSVHSS